MSFQLPEKLGNVLIKRCCSPGPGLRQYAHAQTPRSSVKPTQQLKFLQAIRQLSLLDFCCFSQIFMNEFNNSFNSIDQVRVSNANTNIRLAKPVSVLLAKSCLHFKIACLMQISSIL